MAQRVQVIILYNEASWIDKFEGYLDSHPLRKVFSTVMYMEGKNAREIAEDYFRAWNLAARPGNVRSMSVGDVVCVGEVCLACERAGWKVVSLSREKVTG